MVRGSIRLCVIALAAIVSATAYAQADAIALGYADATFFQMGYGSYYAASNMVITGGGGEYNNSSLTTVGSKWTLSAGGGGEYATGRILGENAGFGPMGYSSAYSTAAAAPQEGGAGVMDSVENYNFTTITNETNNYDYLVVEVITAASSYASAGTIDNAAYSSSFAEFYDTDNKLTVFAGATAQALGLGGGGSSYSFEQYDPTHGYQSGSGFLGDSFPSSVSSSAGGFVPEFFTLLFAPGQSDTFYAEASEQQESYSITPGPASVAPFACGLLGVIGRRSRRLRHSRTTRAVE